MKKALAILTLVFLATAAGAAPAPGPAPSCTDCAAWNAAQKPFRIYGNTYYVGPRGIASILITSDSGHVLIDGALPESAAAIAGHIRELGFHVEDVKLILNSHTHFDHAGGIAELQRISGAAVVASPRSAPVLMRGESGPDDPQFGSVPGFPPVRAVGIVHDGETLRSGSLAVTAHLTGGHTPGGTSWTWRSCEAGRCVDIVYADSLTPLSSDRFHYLRSAEYPQAIGDFEKSFAFLDSVPCDVLLTPHPGASGLWDRLARRDGGDAGAMIDAAACRRYAGTARRLLRERIERENGVEAKR